MELHIDPAGTIHCVYDEAVPLTELGAVNIQRASHVEPTCDGQWTADLAPVAGPVLGPFAHRSAALAAERVWLDEHWLANRS